LEKDLREARKCYNDVLEAARSMSSTMGDLEKSMTSLKDVTNFQAAFIGDWSDNNDAFQREMGEHVKEAMATFKVHRQRINQQEEKMDQVHERVTRRRKEIDDLNGLVGVVHGPFGDPELTSFS
jgi:methyl-accepting chemotaxis protein